MQCSAFRFVFHPANQRPGTIQAWESPGRGLPPTPPLRKNKNRHCRWCRPLDRRLWSGAGSLDPAARAAAATTTAAAPTTDPQPEQLLRRHGLHGSFFVDMPRQKAPGHVLRLRILLAPIVPNLKLLSLVWLLQSNPICPSLRQVNAVTYRSQYSPWRLLSSAHRHP